MRSFASIGHVAAGSALLAIVVAAAPSTLPAQLLPAELLPAQLGAVDLDGSGSGIGPASTEVQWNPHASIPARSFGSGTPGAGRTFLASLVLPGAGQWMRGEGRAYAYLAVEVASWLGFAHARGEGNRSRDRYRLLAWTEARLSQEGDRVVDDFRYYEAMANYAASGTWDTDPLEPGIQPETDPTTFNGRVWELARGLYFSDDGGDPDPSEVEQALDYYRDRGFSTELLWEWDPEGTAMDEYRMHLEESDEAFRRSTVLLGVVAANHILSAVDAFVSSRIGAEFRSALHPIATPGSLESGSWLPDRWSLQFSITGAR